MTVYETCTDTYGDDTLLVVQCVAEWVESFRNATNADDILQQQYVSMTELTDWLLVLTGALVFFMQAGFAMVCAGAIRKKNINNTMLKNLLDACGAGIAFYCLGYGLAYGHSGSATATFVGNANFFLSGDNVNLAAFFFQYAFSATCVTIIAGTLAERCRMAAYFAYSVFLTGFVYPVVAHNVWSAQGYFSIFNPEHALIGIGMVDFSGSGVIHMTGGCVALYATYILGPRQGRFQDRHGNPLSRPGLTKGHSVALQLLGTFILFFGWFGFNPGSALVLNVDDKSSVAALAAVNTTISAAAATVSALFTFGLMERFRVGEFSLDIVMAMNGCLSGLVGITAGCAVVEPWAALLIGIVAGWIYIGMDMLLLRWKLDDAVAAIQVHLGSGFWGIVSTGLLAAPSHMKAAFGTDSHGGWFYGSSCENLLPAQLGGALFIVFWTMLTTVPFFLTLEYMGLFRVNALEELIGLDMSYLEQEGTPMALTTDEPSDDDAVRLAAYRQRFAERKALRTNKRVSIPNHHEDTFLPAEDKAFSAPPPPPESYSGGGMVPIIRRLTTRATDDEFSRKGSVYSA